MYPDHSLPCPVYDSFRREVGIAVEWRDVTDEPGEPHPLPPSDGVIVVYQDRTWAHLEIGRRTQFHPGEGVSTIAYRGILADYHAGRCAER